MPIEGTVLQMKAMNIDSVINFPFPTPPDRAALAKAEKILIGLGALAKAPSMQGKQVGAKITELGQSMSIFPLSPRHSKMLVTGQQHDCLPYVIAIVSILSVGDPFLHADVVGASDANLHTDQNGDSRDRDADLMGNIELANLKNEDHHAREMRKLKRGAYFRVQQTHAALGKSTSDLFKMLSVVGAYEYEGGSSKFCQDNFLRLKVDPPYHWLCAAID